MDKMSNLELVKEWHRYAEMDLLTAMHMQTIHPALLEIVAYHCQ